MANEDYAKKELDELIKKSPTAEQEEKESISADLQKLVRISQKKSPFRDAQDRIIKLTGLIQRIACIEYAVSEVESFKVIFKNSFKFTKQHFEQIYGEKRAAFLKEKHEKEREAEAQEKIRRLVETQTSLLEIHAILADVSSASHDIIELTIAVAISLKVSMKYNLAPLWLMLVGPPSSDKTATVTTIRDVPFVYHLDTLTENSFISGFVSEDGFATQDLLAELDMKCFVVKDFTALFSLKADTIRKILGDMCAIYDKVFAKFTGTRGRIQYEAAFSHLGCITPVALAGHQVYMNMIGPRFLFYRILPLTNDQISEGYKIAWSGDERNRKLKQLRGKVSAYIWQVQEDIMELKPETPEQIEDINSLADLLRHGRAVIRTELVSGTSKKGNAFTYYEPAEIQIEEPWRALQQIKVLTRSLAIIHKRDHVTDHEIELARRVVMSSMPVNRAEVLYLFQTEDVIANRGQLSRKECAKLIGKGYNQAKRILLELKCIGLLQEAKMGDEYFYYPKERFQTWIVRPMNGLDHIGDLTCV